MVQMSIRQNAWRNARRGNKAEGLLLKPGGGASWIKRLPNRCSTMRANMPRNCGERALAWIVYMRKLGNLGNFLTETLRIGEQIPQIPHFPLLHSRKKR